MQFEIIEKKQVQVPIDVEIQHEVELDISLEDILLMFKFIGKTCSFERENIGMSELESNTLHDIYAKIYDQLNEYEVIPKHYFL